VYAFVSSFGVHIFDIGVQEEESRPNGAGDDDP
jgi:hypothetical protein